MKVVIDLDPESGLSVFSTKITKEERYLVKQFPESYRIVDVPEHLLHQHKVVATRFFKIRQQLYELFKQAKK